MMEMMTKIDKDKKSKIEKAIKILKNGGVAVFPTDTVYGIGSLPEKKAVEKIYKIWIPPRRYCCCFT